VKYHKTRFVVFTEVIDRNDEPENRLMLFAGFFSGSK